MKSARVLLALCAGVLLAYIVALLILPWWLSRQHPGVNFYATAKTLPPFSAEMDVHWIERGNGAVAFSLPMHWSYKASSKSMVCVGEGIQLLMHVPNRINHQRYAEILHNPWNIAYLIQRPLIIPAIVGAHIYQQPIGIWNAYIYSGKNQWAVDLFRGDTHILITVSSVKPITEAEGVLIRKIIANIRVMEN